LLAAGGLRFDCATTLALTIPPVAPPAARLLAIACGARRRLGCRRLGSLYLGSLCLGLRRVASALAAATTTFATVSTFPT